MCIVMVADGRGWGLRFFRVWVRGLRVRSVGFSVLGRRVDGSPEVFVELLRHPDT